MVSNSLDDAGLYPRLDPSGLRHRLRDFPDQCRRACQEALDFPLALESDGFSRIVVAGMGGSAIGGDLLADLASVTGSVPILVSRNYRIRYPLDRGTLVLACSYSGETEETISSFRQAMGQAASIIAVTGGGTLAREAQQNSIPTFLVDYQGEPRSAVGYGFLAPVVILIRLGMLGVDVLDAEDAFGSLDALVEEISEDCPEAKNPAKAMAKALLERLIVVYGSGIYTSVARRWKTQFNENSKVAAFYEALPEAHHNGVVGLSLPAGIKDRTSAVLLQPHGLSPRMELRYRVTQDLMDRESIPHHVVQGHPGSPLTQILTTVLIGDYVSYYLALLQGLDPSPVLNIDYIREKMDQPPSAD